MHKSFHLLTRWLILMLILSVTPLSTANASSEKQKKLIKAISENNVDQAKSILRESFENKTIYNEFNFFEVNEETKTNDTILGFAARKGNVDLVKAILTYAPTPDSQLNENLASPLHAAASKGNLDVVQFLVSLDNVNPNLTTYDGFTPLHAAAAHGKLDVVQFLVSHHKVNSNLPTKDGFTPLHTAAAAGKLDVVKLLVSQDKTDPNLPTKDGLTPLHFAAGLGKLEIVKVLVSHGKADPNLPTKNGLTPLHFAAGSGQFSVLQYLLENGTYPKLKYIGKNSYVKSPLLLAALNQNSEMIKALLMSGKINFKDEIALALSVNRKDIAEEWVKVFPEYIKYYNKIDLPKDLSPELKYLAYMGCDPKDEHCPVCFNALGKNESKMSLNVEPEPEPVIITSCRHLYCSKCFDQLKGDKNRCYLCFENNPIGAKIDIPRISSHPGLSDKKDSKPDESKRDSSSPHPALPLPKPAGRPAH